MLVYNLLLLYGNKLNFYLILILFAWESKTLDRGPKQEFLTSTTNF